MAEAGAVEPAAHIRCLRAMISMVGNGRKLLNLTLIVFVTHWCTASLLTDSIECCLMFQEINRGDSGPLYRCLSHRRSSIYIWDDLG